MNWTSHFAPNRRCQIRQKERCQIRQTACDHMTSNFASKRRCQIRRMVVSWTSNSASNRRCQIRQKYITAQYHLVRASSGLELGKNDLQDINKNNKVNLELSYYTLCKTASGQDPQQEVYYSKKFKQKLNKRFELEGAYVQNSRKIARRQISAVTGAGWRALKSSARQF